jgi:hypothetical protein
LQGKQRRFFLAAKLNQRNIKASIIAAQGAYHQA